MFLQNKYINKLKKTTTVLQPLRSTYWPPIHFNPFNGPLSGTTRVSRYQKSKTNLNFTGARGSEWQWHQLGHICTSPQTDITTPAPHYSGFLQAGCSYCCSTNSIKAL